MLTDLMNELRNTVPLDLSTYKVEGRVGLVIVDEINGFCTVGHGNMAPKVPSKQITNMVRRTDVVARRFITTRLPILVLRDTHDPDRPEPPYPLHGVRGTGEEVLVDELRWLENPDHSSLVQFVNKDCINGVMGGIRATTPSDPTLTNLVFRWINEHRLTSVIVVGICTDICVMDFVLTLLSARNHAVNEYDAPTRMLLPTLKDIVVYEPGCATYDLPTHVAKEVIGVPTAAHPEELTHYMGLYFMASRGAVLSNKLVTPIGAEIVLS